MQFISDKQTYSFTVELMESFLKHMFRSVEFWKVQANTWYIS